ncbi:uncharacterized protein PHACADRAFT_179836 [Phanerochaete carnosa HHB-10118-sp]|uniref:Uncharacterized protein n=1 Tax=Phanerochaete carnosa (strain HHB-10118-sp) TaxID=650164 RepID=K5W9I0_PHACS|nr:uncharacterized protein PHACADRAFT_179836 [Phanerochaete carnosa HHB-10118-sp]EKM60618.1 hypothetical protein PHACADRAFT_179836 [Phanerochaete carnosa HHB-10118-sp]
MYHILDKSPISTFALAEWAGRLAVPKLRTPGELFLIPSRLLSDASTLVPFTVGLAKIGRPFRYPPVEAVAPYFGYICLPADPTTNTALCVDGDSYRRVRLASLLLDLFDWVWLIRLVVVLFLWLAMPIVCSLATDFFKTFTGIARLQATVAEYDIILAQLEDDRAGHVTSLTELTLALDSSHEHLVEIERLKQASTNNAVKLQTAEDELQASKRQVKVLRADLKNIEELSALGLSRIAEATNTLNEGTDLATELEAALRLELAELDEQTVSLEAQLPDLLAAQALLLEEHSMYHTGHLLQEEIKVAEALVSQDVLAVLHDEMSAESSTYDATSAELQKTLASLAFQSAAVNSAERRAQDIHITDIATARARLESLEAELASVNGELAVAHAEHGSLFGECGRLLQGTSTEKESTDKAVEDAAIAQAALLMATSILRSSDLDFTVELEKDIANLTAALAQAASEHEGVQESLASSVAEHHMHMQVCAEHTTEATAQLTFLSDWIAKEQAAFDSLDKESVALATEIAENRDEYEAEQRGLEWRLKMVSEGYAEEETTLEAARSTVPGELKKVRWAHDEELRRHWVAVAGYQLGQQMDDAFADELLASLAESKARLAPLEAEHARMVAFEQAQRKLETVVADASEVAEELKTRDTEIAQVSAEIIDARRSVASLEVEVVGLRSAYNRKLDGFAEQNGTMEKRIAFEGTLRRAECAEVKDRVRLLEAAILLCSPEDGDGG